MIPVYDVMPSGKTPLATIGLVSVQALAFLAQATAPLPPAVGLLPIFHLGLWPAFANVWFLWLFGENVEARMGRVIFLVLYLLCGFAGEAFAGALSDPGPARVSAAYAVSGVLGAYAVLMRNSQFVLWVPVSHSTTEVPAWFLVWLWTLLHLATLLLGPIVRLEPGQHLRTFAGLVVAFALGAALARTLKRPVVWS